MDWRYVNQAKSLFGNDLTVKSSSTPTTMDCEYWGEPAETSIFLGLGRNTASMAYPTDNEQYFEHALEASLDTVAWSEEGSTIHLIFCPNRGPREDDSNRIQHFQLGTHNPSHVGGWLERAEPAFGGSDYFEQALDCFQILCKFLAKKICSHRSSVMLDFIAYAPMDAERIINCLDAMKPLKQVCFGTEEAFGIRDVARLT